MSDTSIQCPGCGARNKFSSGKSALAALLLAFFLGPFGVHRFYVGKTGTGLAMLLISLTIVGLIITGIWSLVDIIIIVCGKFTDKDGNELKL
jgi:TM2 domain-containing membrane protein YozV